MRFGMPESEFKEHNRRQSVQGNSRRGSNIRTEQWLDRWHEYARTKYGWHNGKYWERI